jgi:hypothetical protein
LHRFNSHHVTVFVTVLSFVTVLNPVTVLSPYLPEIGERMDAAWESGIAEALGMP